MILVSLQAIIAVVDADSPRGEYDYVQEVEGGRFVFVMLSIPNDPSAYGQAGSTQDERIRSQYPQSGLYRNDGSTEPIWTVDWFAFRVYISSDGECLVRRGPWPGFSDYDELALAFYRNGQEIRSYRVNELVAFPGTLPHSVSHYTWAEDISFDDQRRLLFAQTLNRERYTFDITTGAILEMTSPLQRIMRSIGMAALAIAIAWYVLLRRKGKKTLKLQP